MSRIVVFGGRGTFGSLLARELTARHLDVAVPGRDRADVADRDSCRQALAGARVAVNAAGPFTRERLALVEVAREQGIHYVDIAEDRAWHAALRERDASFRERGLTAAIGCSSLPGLSLALALQAQGDAREPPRQARVVLFIGNDNRKGRAAVLSFLGQLGRTIAAPQGRLRGVDAGPTVALPEPFGARRTYLVDSPEYDLFPERIGAREVIVAVGFELSATDLVLPGLARLARLGLAPGTGTAGVVSRLGRLLAGRGSSGGTVQVELSWDDGRVRRATLHARAGGQRMAVLPAALVAAALARGEPLPRGVTGAADALGAEGLLSALAGEGYQRL